MCAARINIKSIDYFKFKKLIVDGNRDDYKNCSKEVKSLCDSVQTLNFRDEEFDECDKELFSEICTYYHQILASKRVDPADMRIKSGWWGDHKNAYSAGKLKSQALKDVLVAKAKHWFEKAGKDFSSEEVSEMLDGPGLFVFKHKEHQCFQYIGRASKIFSECGDKLKSAFEATKQEPLAALFVISMQADWEFYFLPVDGYDEEVLRIMENDLILKHDCIWPHGLNFQLHMDSLVQVSEFRKSCLRHHWPPDGDRGDVENEIDLANLRKRLNSKQHEITKPPATGTTTTTNTATTKASAAAAAASAIAAAAASAASATAAETSSKKNEVEEEVPERPSSACSSSTYTIESSSNSSSPTMEEAHQPVAEKQEKKTTRRSLPAKPPAPTSARKEAKADRQKAQTTPRQELQTLSNSNSSLGPGDADQSTTDGHLPPRKLPEPPPKKEIKRPTSGKARPSSAKTRSPAVKSKVPVAADGSRA